MVMLRGGALLANNNNKLKDRDRVTRCGRHYDSTCHNKDKYSLGEMFRSVALSVIYLFAEFYFC